MTHPPASSPLVAFASLILFSQFSSGLFAQVDANNNQMSDIWELKFGVFGSLAALDDDDGDGFTNLAESIHGTDPLDRNSRLGFDCRVDVGSYHFSWLGVADKKYWIESHVEPDGGLWPSLGGLQTGSDGVMSLTTDASTIISVPGRARRDIIRRPDIDNLTELRQLSVERVEFTESDEFSTPRNEASRYGQRVRAYLIPPTTGDYTFYFTSDDQGELYLSSDTSAANLAKIAEIPEWASWDEWDKFGSQISAPITLQASTPYLIEALHQEWWGGDHVRVAWTGPGISFQVIPAQFFAGIAPDGIAAYGGEKRFFKLNAMDGDLDGDGVTDWEERETGLDPLNPNTFGLDDLTYLERNAGGTSTISIRRTTGVLYESAGDSTKFIIERRGGYDPVTVNYAVSGTTTSGVDHTAFASGSINLARGVHRAEFDISILVDADVEDTETLTVSISPGAYEIGANSSASVELEDSPPTLFLARLTAQNGAQTAASGVATVWLKGNELYANVSLYFSNLTSTQTAAHIHDGDGDAIVFSLPNGTFQNLRWPLREAIPGNPAMEPDILDQITKLRNGGLYVNVHTENFAPGEILGYLAEAQASETFVPPPDPPALPNIPVTDEAASRFLTQASFGPTTAEIGNVVAQGYDTWIANQMALPATLHRPRLEAKSNHGISERQEVWWYHSTHAPDQLRQRVAFALSEIFVISDEDGTLRGQQVAMAHYYDMLLGHAFGNFRQLLEDVTLSPMMGTYLSSLRNEKEDPGRGISPDENFAREIQQLFTIGLWQLHPDGTAKLGQTGLTVPTYDQDDIVGFSRVFTGWAFKKEAEDPNFYWGDRDYLSPMELYDEYHEDGEKHVINDVVIPANQGGTQDLADALDLLFNHPNVGPFIARRLIQRLVTSNPSPGYIYRVAQVFDDNGSGVRGDLGAVVRAILLDYEARSTDHIDFVGYGHLKEPLVRIVGLMRAFNASQPNGELSIRWFIDEFGQGPMSSPTVFNFFTPDYSQPGPISAAGLTSPEFQITSETTTILTANFIYYLTDREPRSGDNDRLVLDLTSLSESQGGQPPLTDDPNALVDHLDSLLMGGDMTAAKKTQIITAVNAVDNDDADDRRDRARVALHLVVTSPEYVVQK